MVAIVVASEYGYVLGAYVASALHLFYLAAKTGTARKAANIPYPYIYADMAEAEKDPKKNIFNCVQRAHLNTLEMFPVYTALLLTGGIQYPEISAGASVVYLLGRHVYALGYSTGEPKKRARGSFAYLGLIAMLGTSACTIYSLVKN